MVCCIFAFVDLLSQTQPALELDKHNATERQKKKEENQFVGNMGFYKQFWGKCTFNSPNEAISESKKILFYCACLRPEEGQECKKPLE